VTFFPLPDDLPVPVDDGRAAHLVGMAVPDITLPSTRGGEVSVRADTGRTILFLYPKTGVPGQQMPDGWDAIPGARGCTPEACGFRDQYEIIGEANTTVYGLSSQDSAYQTEMANRLGLPYPVLSDPEFRLAAALSLPTFEVPGERLYVHGGRPYRSRLVPDLSNRYARHRSGDLAHPSLGGP